MMMMMLVAVAVPLLSEEDFAEVGVGDGSCFATDVGWGVAVGAGVGFSE